MRGLYYYIIYLVCHFTTEGTAGNVGHLDIDVSLWSEHQPLQVKLNTHWRLEEEQNKPEDTYMNATFKKLFITNYDTPRRNINLSDRTKRHMIAF